MHRLFNIEHNAQSPLGFRRGGGFARDGLTQILTAAYYAPQLPLRGISFPAALNPNEQSAPSTHP